MSTTFSSIVDQVHGLDAESKEELLVLIRQWLIEERRTEILRHATEAETAHRQGEAQRGSADELMDDLYGED